MMMPLLWGPVAARGDAGGEPDRVRVDYVSERGAVAPGRRSYGFRATRRAC